MIKRQACHNKLGLGTLLMWACIATTSDLFANGRENRTIIADTSSTLKTNNAVNRTSKAIEFFGFVKYDLFADTRQVVNAREGLVSIYPENPHYDADGRDINSGLNVNMLSIHSRVGIRAHGPVLLNAETGALIEADFYGNANSQFSDLNGLRLFNAYIDFRWKSTELRLGQDWHPMSVREFFPNTVSFSAGAPFHPMSRNPQARFCYSTGSFQILGAILSQRDFTSTGPEGPSSHYLRNAGIPNIHLQARYDRDTVALSGGVGVDYKRIVPALSSVGPGGEFYKSKRSLSSLSITGFMKYKMNGSTLTAQSVYAQNAYDLLMLGGYAERNLVDAERGANTYTNVNVISFWVDFETTFRSIHFGAFAGYTKNLGAANIIGDVAYTRGENIGWIYRLSPRIAYTDGPIGVAFESEYTVAAYGTANGNGRGVTTDLTRVPNLRSVLSVKYVF